MAHRRGFLGLMGAMGVGLQRSYRGADAERNMVRGIDFPSPAGLVGAAANAADEEKKWNLFQKASRHIRDREERQNHALHLMNGWPPGVFCCQSQAPWFRAMVAARKAQERSKENQSLYDKIREKFWDVVG